MKRILCVVLAASLAASAAHANTHHAQRGHHRGGHPRHNASLMGDPSLNMPSKIGIGGNLTSLNSRKSNTMELGDGSMKMSGAGHVRPATSSAYGYAIPKDKRSSDGY